MSECGTYSFPLIRLQKVSKIFPKDVEVLRGLNLDIHQGECVSLLGPSGCGKTTILRLVAGLSPVSAGRVERDAEVDFGFVFQEPSLMPWATVFSNVGLPLRLKGYARQKARPLIMEALEKVGLSSVAQSYPRVLSGGMKMRVSLARALVTKPQILLLDEPFAALDEITRHRLNEDLLGLKNALGATIVFVTHSVYESVYLSNRILIMTPRPGRIFAEIRVPADSARDARFRLTSLYADICRETSILLHNALQ